MQSVAATGPIYRLPPYVLGPKVYTADELEDIIDWGLKAQRIPAEWQDTQGEGIVVGVADTGRPNHPDINDNIIDSHNFSLSFTDEDLQGHSTHVCGTIAAIDNNKGVVGVAPKAKIITAKVLGDDGSGDNLAVARGIRWLVNKGCQVINMSLGGPYDKEIAQACIDAVEAGVYIVCAAGNEGYVDGQNTIGYPARLKQTVAIASYNKAGRLSDYSSRGPEVNVAFPGEDILSTWLNGSYRRLSGTSMASPFASAVTALLLSKQEALISAAIANGDNPPVSPVTNAASLIARLQGCAVDKGPVGFDSGWGWGIVDVKKFLMVSAPDHGGGHDGGDDGGSDETPLPPTQCGFSGGDIDLGFLRVRGAQIDGEKGIFVTP